MRQPPLNAPQAAREPEAHRPKAPAAKTALRSASPWSPAFHAYMKEGWQARRARKVPKVAGHAYIARRRAALGRLFAGELLLIPTGHEKVRANDTFYPFRPGSDFYYLTGSLEPDGVLVLDVDAQGRARSTLFVEGNRGRETDAFYADRDKGELWVGPRLTLAESAQRFGIEDCRALSSLPDALRDFLADKKRPWRLVRGIDAALEARVAPARSLKKGEDAQRQRDVELAAVLSEMRLVKDKHEVRALELACESTAKGFDDVIERLREGFSEREVEGVFNLRARVEGNAVGYNTIAAAGHHACTLHWSQNDGPLSKGDLLLLDAGVEGVELYTADVTRTLPISGKFTAAQKEIYTLVYEAQQAGLRAVMPGNDFMAANEAAMKVLAHGLQRLGILEDAERDLMPDRQLYRRYTLHMVSHMLGIDVHDCASARSQSYKFGRLQPGMVLTVEPGLYFQPDDLTVPKRYRGIGVRIEDDVLVTAKGHRILSELPREAGEVEAWMKRIWATRKAPASAQAKRAARR